MEHKLQELKRRLREIFDIQSVLELLGWDQHTHMPPAGAEARGSQMSTLGRIAHEKMTDPVLGELLEELKPLENSLPADSDDAALIRVARREYEQATRVPAAFVSRFYDHLAKKYQAWLEAREEDDFEIVRPYLEQTLEFSREYSSFFPGAEHVADPLIDRNDYGMKAAELKKLFAALRERLVPLVEEVTALPPVERSFLFLHYPQEKQIEFGKRVIKAIGFDFNRGRQDFSPHPFMTRFAHGDIRITTRVKENDLTEALFSSIHEAGHALYEMGIDPTLDGTPLYDGISSGVHESQSRLWENVVGRSLDFWTHFYPLLQETFPSQLGNVTLEQFYRAINHVERSLIRTDADELTYNLHVILRFDLELAMLEGKLAVRDLPEAWNTRYREDLGIEPPNQKLGVLQDVHWYSDFIGGVFQGYTLGNILSAQFYHAALQARPDIPGQMRQGRFDALHGWLKENVYRHGKKFTADEIVERATGSSLTVEPYLRYLGDKYTAIYQKMPSESPRF
jgi:carboxypeptidase Taq